MSEELNSSTHQNPFDDGKSRELYERRKMADKAVSNLTRITLKNALGMAMGGKYRTDLMAAENQALESRNIARQDLEQHYPERVREAIFDFQKDPANAGKALNLPDSGLPKIATNVQPLPAQEQNKS